MNMYWLTRTGGPAEGPFTLAQLKSMYQAGHVPATAQVCVDGTEDWLPLTDELEHEQTMQRQLAGPRSAPPPMPRLQEGKLKRGSKSGGLGCFLLIVAIIMLVIFWPIGIVVGVLAVVVDSMSLYYHCSICGNETAKSSRQCPHCKASLKKSWWS